MIAHAAPIMLHFARAAICYIYNLHSCSDVTTPVNGPGMCVGISGPLLNPKLMTLLVDITECI